MWGPGALVRLLAGEARTVLVFGAPLEAGLSLGTCWAPSCKPSRGHKDTSNQPSLVVPSLWLPVGDLLAGIEVFETSMG